MAQRGLQQHHSAKKKNQQVQFTSDFIHSSYAEANKEDEEEYIKSPAFIHHVPRNDILYSNLNSSIAAAAGQEANNILFSLLACVRTYVLHIVVQ